MPVKNGVKMKMKDSGWTGKRTGKKEPFDFGLLDPKRKKCIHANTANTDEKEDMKVLIDTMADFEAQMKKDEFYNNIAYCVVCGTGIPT